MPANNSDNGGYEKVSLLDEFDENENIFKNPETKYELSVSLSLLIYFNT